MPARTREPTRHLAYEALEGAEELISRLQQDVADYLPPDSEINEQELVGEIIEELETAPEIEEVRETLGEDPDRFGEAAPEENTVPAELPPSAALRH